jgi:hypothetical protein
MHAQILRLSVTPLNGTDQTSPSARCSFQNTERSFGRRRAACLTTGRLEQGSKRNGLHCLHSLVLPC